MSIEQKQQLNQQQLAILATEMEKRKKSTGLAYILWLFLGTLGIHKFYAGQKTAGIIYLILGILGWATVWIGVGFVFFAILGVLLLIDLFTIPKQIGKANDQEEAGIIEELLKAQAAAQEQ